MLINIISLNGKQVSHSRDLNSAWDVDRVNKSESDMVSPFHSYCGDLIFCVIRRFVMR